MAVKKGNTRLNVTLSEEERNILDYIALKNGRSSANQSAIIIREWLDENDYLSGKKYIGISFRKIDVEEYEKEKGFDPMSTEFYDFIHSLVKPLLDCEIYETEIDSGIIRGDYCYSLTLYIDKMINQSTLENIKLEISKEIYVKDIYMEINNV